MDDIWTPSDELLLAAPSTGSRIDVPVNPNVGAAIVDPDDVIEAKAALVLAEAAEGDPIEADGKVDDDDADEDSDDHEVEEDV